MTLAEKEQRLAEVRKSINSLNTQIKPLTEEASTLYKEINDEKLESIFPLTLEKLFSTPTYILDTDKGYKAVTEVMKDYKYTYISGHNSATKTKWVEVMLYQDRDFAPQLDCVLEIIKHIVYQTNEAYKNAKGLIKHPTKYKMFGVFHQETEHQGIYQVMVDESNQAYLINTRYHTSSLVQQLPLEQMLKYIFDNHPYKSNKSEESCEDEG